MDNPIKLTELIMGLLPSAAIGVAAELGIADLLEREPMTAEQLAATTKTNARMLFRLLRYLASLGVFEADGNGRFKLSPMASLLRSNAENSMRSTAQLIFRIGPRSADRLLAAIQSGECPFDVAFGQPAFEYLSTRPDDAAVFDAAMNGFHGGETGAVLEAYDFSGIATLADIGSGNGTVLMEILRRYPSMHGVFFDQPHVIERARGAINAAGMTTRAELAPGSFFEAVPAGADAYHMRHIIHDWEDEPATQILRNIRRVIPRTGRVLIVEAIVPEGNEPSPAKVFDIAMMMWPKGVERTQKEYSELLKAAGFELSGTTPTQSPVWVIEGRPV